MLGSLTLRNLRTSFGILQFKYNATIHQYLVSTALRLYKSRYTLSRLLSQQQCQIIIHQIRTMFPRFRFLQAHYERFLRLDEKFDARVCPSSILQELKSKSSKKKCMKMLTKKTNNGYRIMRRLSFVHMMLMYSPDAYELVQEFLESPNQSADDWLNKQCVFTYYHFLKKVASSRELFNQIREVFSVSFSFEKLFYVNHLLVDLFKIVHKMPLLGRYFKENNQPVTCSFIETIAVQAQKLYTPYKAMLQDLLSNHKKYLKSREDEQLVKIILEECLPAINEQMKKLFLDKYFYPYGKGIGVRLFRAEEQNEECIKIIRGIVNDHKDTERRLAQQDLQKTLFPEQGKINLEFYEQTLMQEKKKYEEVCEDLEDIEEEEVIPTQFDDTEELESKHQKETGHQMQICNDV